MTTTPSAILLPINVDEDAMSASPYQGERIASTITEAIQYGLGIMDLRQNEIYEKSPADVKAAWESHTDDYVGKMRAQTFPGATTEETELLQKITDILNLQRRREREESHLSHDSIILLWLQISSAARQYLKPKA